MASLAIILVNYNDSRWLINWFDKMGKGVVPDEIIVVDDCSTDGSVDLLMLIKQKHPYLKIAINKNRMGPFAAFIEGVKIAEAEFVSCWSCDDEMQPDYIRKMKEAINNFPLVDLYLCNALVEREGCEYRRAYFAFDVFLSPDYLVRLYKNTNPSMINMIGLVIRKSLVLEAWEDGGKNIPTCFDGMYLFYAAFNKGMIVLGDCLVRYRASFKGWGAKSGYFRNRISERRIMEIWRKYPAIWKRANESRIWSKKTSFLASLGLFVIARIPKWMRKIVYRKYYAMRNKETCGFGEKAGII